MPRENESHKITCLGIVDEIMHALFMLSVVLWLLLILASVEKIKETTNRLERDFAQSINSENSGGKCRDCLKDILVREQEIKHGIQEKFHDDTSNSQ